MPHSPGNRLAAGLAGLFLLTGPPVLTRIAPPAFAQGALPAIRIDPALTQRERTVLLEITVNGETTGNIEEFIFNPAGNVLSVRRSRLERAGVKVPGAGSGDALVRLDTLGLPFNYDEGRQQVHFTLRNEQRLPREYSARGQVERPKPQISNGMLLNYSFFGGSFRDFRTGQTQFSGANLSFDARAFSKFGVFTQTGIAGTTIYNDNRRFLRLESTYTYSDQDRLLTARAGDIISGALNWTRPIRMAGVQLQRDFSMRTDLVTRPVPVLAGTAAVPSTVDVYINGLRTYSQQVGSGPFSITNLPMLAGSGDARVVVRDASGREVEQRVQLTDPARLLRPGLTDFSIEAGFARRDFGLLSNGYDQRLLASATLRRGITPWLTLEAHGEAGAGLTHAGAGAVMGLGAFGTLQLAASASRHTRLGEGVQLYGGWDKRFGWLSVSISSQRTIGRYEDLASVTAKFAPLPEFIPLPGSFILPGASSLSSLKPPRALDRISISAPLWFDRGSMTLGLIHSKRDDGVRNKLVTLSYNRPLPWRANLFATAFADFGTNRNVGVFAGLSMPILHDVYGSTGFSMQNGNATGTAEINKPQKLEDGTYGYRLRTQEGEQAIRTAAGSYRSPYGQFGAQIQQFGNRGDATVSFDGSVAVMGGGVFFGNKVHSSFAVVDAGVAGVPVLQDNRIVGRTNGSGKMLVTNLRPYEANSIAIDPSKLPASYDAGTASTKIAPHRLAGVHVNFAKQASANAALVVFTGADGKLLPTGSRGRTARGEDFLVGYDGQAYIRDLAASNSVTIDLGTRECKAAFAFAPRRNEQVKIDRVVCR